MRKQLLTALLFFFFATIAISQLPFKNANIWYFGDRAGVDFNSTPPVVLLDGEISTQEGVATICDSDGALLFYTDGSSVWDKNHNLMPNGDYTLFGHWSSTQSAIIVPIYGEINRYYIFTTDEGAGYRGLRYSEVDISLPGNGTSSEPLGDLVTESLNTPLIAPVCEKVTCVLKSNMIDYWVLTHGWTNNEFYAYEVTMDGVNTEPVISEVGGIHNGGTDNINTVGYMKASVDRSKIAVVNRNTEAIELFDFNSETGVLSNAVVIPMDGELLYGIEFSPNGRYLYIASSHTLFRYDLYTEVVTSVDIDDSSVFSGTNISIRAMQLAPDGNIYVSIRYNEYLSAIYFPNLATAYLETKAIYLDEDETGRECLFGLPNIFYFKGYQNDVGEITTHLQNIVVYPNPANDFVQISGIESGSVIIYDSEGRFIKRAPLDSSMKVDFSGLPDGNYLLSITSDGERIVKKVIISH
ncbi:MAG: hypothetical protein A2W91_14500 [Bacteroidetes bacterium GWF2_38_335]|nr:MAG: hypothetical protein A2W91_14500 [Bacteroidetes bacterium GWF2_38_335]OFY79330.1 MAG: hypothetical protein A2281_16655 [Bacteroidetes bacterium RIFOXYA12_FULL_38_20]HBS85589.1 hypothetical protein [Bacteroidales bacterium]